MLFCFLWKIKNSCHRVVSININNLPQAQHKIFEKSKVKEHLVQWIHRHNQCRSPWSTVLLQQRYWTSLKIWRRWKRIWSSYWVSSKVKNSSWNISHVNLQDVNNLEKATSTDSGATFFPVWRERIQRWLYYTSKFSIILKFRLSF